MTDTDTQVIPMMTRNESHACQAMERTTSNKTEPADMGEKSTARVPSVKVAIVGNVDSGKSTLCGLLSKGIADDGNGKTRATVFNYNHENSSGRTSSVAHEIMGWDEDGKQQFPDHFSQNKNKYWNEVVKKSSKFVNLIDLCGHEKYLKTTMTGMVGLVPDYAMVIVGANLGLSKMTREHLGIAMSMKLPFFIVVTKVDMVDKAVLDQTVSDLKKLMKHPSCGKMPLVIEKDEDINFATSDIDQPASVLCPIFKVSSVSLENIDLLIKFFYRMKSRNAVNPLIGSNTDPLQIGIHETFTVKGVGLTMAGTLLSGTLNTGQVVLCGPDKLGKFKSLVVSSVHVNRVPVETAYSGDYICCAVKPANKKNVITRKDIRKGMMLLDPNLEPVPAWEFDALVEVLQITARISIGYQAYMHCGMIRQSVTVVTMDKDVLMPKDIARVRFRFMFSPEYIRKDLPLLIREGRTKVKGTITRVVPIKEPVNALLAAPQQEMMEGD